jgi:ATP-binding cassette subfamily B multidrug efflux pump
MSHVFALRHFLKPYRLLALLSLACLFVLVALDLAIPRLIERIIDEGIGRGDQALVLTTGAVMLGISALNVLFSLANNRMSIMVGEGVARDVREALFTKIQSLSYGNLDELRTGDLLVRLTSDTTAFQRLTQVTLRIGTRAPITMIGSLILMIYTSTHLALTILPILLVTIVLIVFFVLKTEPLVRGLQAKLDALNNVLQENVAGARLVKAFVRSAQQTLRFETTNAGYAEEATRVMRLTAAMGPLLTICVNVGMVVVILVGGADAVRGELTVGQVVAFTNYLLTTMTPLIMMTMLAQMWAAGIASARRVSDVLNAVPEVQPPQQPRALPQPLRGRIEFERVSFHYHSQPDELVLDDVRFVAEPGRTVAILGATGAGKSTLVNLVPRFYDATSGRVTIDGVDVREVAHEELLGCIALVPQETILFSGSVRDNIRYGVPGASDEEVLAAARSAQAHDFVMRLPAGYDTHIEERGVNLSGGQKQRLAIARALLARPKILILDDSTSAVDVDTETRIQAALHATQGEQTRLIVAQRISTVLHADHILVLDRGRIAAEGTHAQLLRESAIYREIYETQLGGAPSEFSIEVLTEAAA